MKATTKVILHHCQGPMDEKSDTRNKDMDQLHTPETRLLLQALTAHGV